MAELCTGTTGCEKVDRCKEENEDQKKGGLLRYLSINFSIEWVLQGTFDHARGGIHNPSVLSLLPQASIHHVQWVNVMPPVVKGA